MKIPKKIHYCWFGGAEYPELIKRCLDSWERNLVGWDLILWNEKNSPITDEHPYLKKAISDKKYAFASDYMRCLALYQYGGVYLDTDMEVIRSLDELLDNAAFIAPENTDGDIFNVAAIGAVKGHDLLKDIMKYYNSLESYEPIPDVVVKIMSSKKYAITKLSRSSFYPYNPYDPKQKVKQLMFNDVCADTYGIHHWHASWKPSFRSRLKNFIKIHILRVRKY